MTENSLAGFHPLGILSLDSHLTCLRPSVGRRDSPVRTFRCPNVVDQAISDNIFFHLSCKSRHLLL